MPVFLVANPKGGVGKSTVATNLAGYFARQGHRTVLGDAHRHQSSRAGPARRAAPLREVEPWVVDEARIARPRRGVSHVVLVSPAALHGSLLKESLKVADRVIVPLQASLFDIY